MRITVYGPPGKIVLIEIRDPENRLMYWNQTTILDQGYVNISIPILEYWKYGIYTVYASMLRGPRIRETFIIGKRIGSNIFLFTTMNTTDIYSRNNFTIILNPPINTTASLTVSNILGEKVYERNISLKNGYGVFSLKFNETGIYVLNISWSGNEYYNSSYHVLRLNVIGSRVERYSLNYDIRLNENIVSVNDFLNISIYPKERVDLVIYNPFYRKVFYGIDSILLAPNVTGIWLCYIRSQGNLLRSRPKIFYVKEKVDMTLSLDQGIVYKREDIRIMAEIGMERCFGKINLYLWNSGRWIYIDSAEIYYNIAIFHWRTSREGTYMFKAIWSGDGMHFSSESNVLVLTVYARNLSVTFEVVDNNNRIIYGSKIVIGNKTYDTREGRLSLILKDDVYNVSVIWKNLSIYEGSLNISREDVYRIKCKVYDLTIRLVGWIYNPIIDESVYIEGNGIKMTQISNRAGEVCFKQLPIGNYTVKTSIGERKIYLNENMVLEIRYPPPWEEIKVAIIVIIAIIIAIMILRRYVKIEIVIEREEDLKAKKDT